MKKLINTLLMIIAINTSYAQVQLVTSGFTSTGGYSADEISLDYSAGQVFSKPYSTTNISGNEGILQIFPELVNNTTALQRIEVNIYPNPTADFLNVSLNDPSSFSIALYDLNGLLIIKGKKNQNEIDLHNIPSGIYYMIIRQSGIENSFKINKI